VVCECLVILNPYIYLAVGAAPQRRRGGGLLPHVPGWNYSKSRFESALTLVVVVRAVFPPRT